MATIDNKKGDFELILALSTGNSVKEAAERAGIAERTAHRRLKDPKFRISVSTTRDELFTQAVGKLAEAATGAIATLVDLLGSTSPTARLGAARAILEHGPKLRDQCELEARITAMEALHNAK